MKRKKIITLITIIVAILMISIGLIYNFKKDSGPKNNNEEVSVPIYTCKSIDTAPDVTIDSTDKYLVVNDFVVTSLTNKTYKFQSEDNYQTAIESIKEYLSDKCTITENPEELSYQLKCKDDHNIVLDNKVTNEIKYYFLLYGEENCIKNYGTGIDEE